VKNVHKSSTFVTIGGVKAHEKEINHVAIGLDDATIATASLDKTVKIWKRRDEAPFLSLAGTLSGHKRGVWNVSFSPVDKVCGGREERERRREERRRGEGRGERRERRERREEEGRGERGEERKDDLLIVVTGDCNGGRRRHHQNLVLDRFFVPEDTRGTFRVGTPSCVFGTSRTPTDQRR
jgi:hypothetical protein